MTALSGVGDRRGQLVRRGLRLEYATLGWNVAAIGLLVVSARSVALAGFAADSLIEIFASLVVVGELRGSWTDAAAERRALRRIGVAFYALSAYVLVQGVVVLVTGVRAEASPLGIGVLAATCMVMLALAWGKARTGAELGHAVLSAEARVTVVDAALAGGTLIGLLLNAAWGWWWADLLAAALIVTYAIREAREHLRA